MRALCNSHVALAVSVLTIALHASGDPIAGDVDASGSDPNAVDVQLVVNGALNLPVAFDTDLDYSGSTNAVDVQLVINAVLGLPIDADFDGLCDGAEGNLNTAANSWDSDKDSVGDGQEMLDGTDPLDGADYAQTNLKMSFEGESWTYYAQGESAALELFPAKVAVRVAALPADDLIEWLETDPLVKFPLEIEEFDHEGIWLVALQDGATEPDILAFIDRVNQSGLAHYGAPVFRAPSARIVVTDEFVVKFKQTEPTAAIEAYINQNRARILKADFLWPKCYVLGFTSAGGANPLAVARAFFDSDMVEYAHPNFLMQTEPPSKQFQLEEEEEDPVILYPNLFAEYDNIVQTQPWPTGWVTIMEEDFEDPAVFDGPRWLVGDFNADDGFYYWGRVSDIEYPTYPYGGYVPLGHKGWVSAGHNVGAADLYPEPGDPESYAPSMNARAVYGPFDLTSAYWARLWYNFRVFSTPYEVFQVGVSINGVDFYGGEIGTSGDYICRESHWGVTLEHRGMRRPLDLTNVPTLGDVTGQPTVWIEFKYATDSFTNWDSDLVFFGAYIDDIRLEQSNFSPVAALTTDPLSAMQWGLRNTGMPAGVPDFDLDIAEAWYYLASDPDASAIEDGIVVAVLDEGVDLTHPDLNLVAGYDATYDPDAPLRAGPIGDNSYGGPLPWNGHGTACAGIIGAMNNDIGTVGVAPGVRIMPVRIAWAYRNSGWVTTAAKLADGILWAANNGAKVLSNSWGGSLDSDVYHDAIRDARAMGCTIVFASGNDNEAEVSFPARYEEVIAVGAASPAGERKNPDSADGEWWWGSNYGDNLDIMGPGVLIATTDITGGDGYRDGDHIKSFNGTSSACPHVAGVAALMLTLNPSLTPDEVQATLQETATDMLDAGWDQESGWGLVNADAALQQTRKPVDLLALQWSAPAEASPGEGIEATFEIKNDSAETVGPFAIAVYLSLDDTVDGGDAELHASSLTLTARETAADTRDLTIPADAAAGWQSLILALDTGDAVVETDEVNNFAVHTIRILPPPSISLKPASVDFGELTVGQMDSRYIHIHNEGNGLLEVTGIVYSGDPEFSVNTAALPFTIDPWEERLFEVLFEPVAEGQYSGIVTVSSTDPDDPEVVLNLAGAGSEPITSLMRATPSQLIFGSSVPERPLAILNDGDGTVDWNVTDNLPAWLAVSDMSGQSTSGSPFTVSVAVDRAGLSEGVYTHELSLTSNGGDAAVAAVMVAITVGGAGSTWAWTYGDLGWDYIHDDDMLRATRDGGYLVAGNTNSFGQGREDFCVLKLDAAGAMQWSKTYGGSGIDKANTAIELRDGGYIVGGNSYTFRTGSRYSDGWILWLNATGSVDWQRNYGGSYQDIVEAIRETADGGFIVAGQTTSSGAGGYDLWVFKLTSAGSVEWSRTYGGASDEFARSLDLTRDGGYVVAADTQSMGAGDRDIWVLKLDSSGDVDWAYTYGGGASDVPCTVYGTDDGGFAVGATTSSFGAGESDFWMLKLDSGGAPQWQYVYGGGDSDRAEAMRPTGDGGFILSGTTQSFDSKAMDCWVVKLDPVGTVLWENRYDKNAHPEIDNSNWGFDIAQAYDGGYVLLGEANWEGEQNGDIWVVKLDESGAVGCDIESATNAAVAATQVAPVPTETLGAEFSIGGAESPGITEDISIPGDLHCDPTAE